MAPALFIGHKKEIQSGSGLLLKINWDVWVGIFQE